MADIYNSEGPLQHGNGDTNSTQGGTPANLLSGNVQQEPVRGQTTASSQGEILTQPTEAINSAKENVSVHSTGGRRSLPKVFVVLVLVVVIALLAVGGVYLLRKLRSPSPAKKGELIWWGLRDEESVYKPLIEEYQRNNPEVKITYIKQSPQDYRERLTNSLASGKGPDVFEIHNSWAPMFRTHLGTLPSSVMDKKTYTETFYPAISTDLSTGEGVIGMPIWFDAITLFVNEDIFGSAGKSYPKTWNELRDVAAELSQSESNGSVIQSGVALGNTENVDHWPEVVGLMMIQNGVNLAKPEGSRLDDALAFYSRFKEVGDWNNTLPASTFAFANGKVAMYFGPTWRASEIVKTNPSLRFRTLPLPQLPKASPEDPDYSYATYWVQGVWGKSSKKEVAWDFLKFLTTKESLEKLNINLKNVGLFPRPYPRRDMSVLQLEDPIVGSVIVLAPKAKSWYLAGDTQDGPTGINTQFNTVFAAAIQEPSKRKDLSSEVAKLLSQYGLSRR